MIETDTVLPPVAIESEQHLLAAILFGGQDANLIRDTLRPSDFYHQPHRQISESIFELLQSQQPVDATTVVAKNRALRDYIFQEMSEVLTIPTSFDYHLLQVQAKSQAREYLRLLAEAQHQALDSDSPSIGNTITKLQELQTRTSPGDFQDAYSVTKDVLSQAREYQRTDKLPGVPTGFKSLDDVFNGFKPGNTIIIGARPGVGKTSFAVAMAKEVSLNHDKGVAFVSIEMPKEQIATRLLASMSDVPYQAIELGQWLEDQEYDLEACVAQLEEKQNLHIIDAKSSIHTVPDIETKVRRLRAKGKLVDLLIIDYLGLLGIPGMSKDNLTSVITEVSKQLRQLAANLALPVVVLCQLNRNSEQRGDKKPTMADLRQSGAIEQDADIVILLHQDKPEDGQPNKLQVCVAKNRNGKTGHTSFNFSPQVFQLREQAIQAFEQGSW